MDKSAILKRPDHEEVGLIMTPKNSYSPLGERNKELNVTNTWTVVAKKNDDGEEFINQYMIVKELGK